MALSMFLRNPACTSRMFAAGAQTMRLATAAALPQRIATNSLIQSSALKETTNTPILNAVRTLRTSSPNLSAEQGHQHARMWVIERAVTSLMIPLIPIGLIMPNKVVDSILAILITAHSFWGLEAIAVDYVRAVIFGPLVPKLAMALVYIISAATLGGLFYLISHDIGLCNSVRQLWAVKGHSA